MTQPSEPPQTPQDPSPPLSPAPSLEPVNNTLLRDLGKLLWLSLPIIITMTSHTLKQTVDALMIGRHDKFELAGLAPAGLTYWTIHALIFGVITCNNTFVSQSLGRGRPHDCARFTVHAIYLGLFAQICMLPIIAGSSHLFALLRHKPDVLAHEVTYFRVIALQMAASGAIVAFTTFFAGTGRPVIPMITGIVANLLNVLLDYLFIYGKFGFPQWGIFGAGLATTIAAYFEAVLLLIVFIGPALHARFATRRWLPFEFSKIRRLFRVGLPTGLTFFLDLASLTVFASYILGRLGSDTLAANTAAGQIMHLSFMPVIGLNIGITALVGRAIGKGDIAGAKRRAYLGMGVAFVFMTLMAVFFVVCRRYLVSQFNEDPEVIRIGGIILIYGAIYQLSQAFGIVSRGALKGAGDTKFPALIQFLFAWFVFVPLAYYLGRPETWALRAASPETWALHGAWIAATVYIWIVDIILFRRFVGERWRRINIFE